MTNDFNETCGNLASVLTAFFDGQATPAEARYARAHLEQCARCAELWSAWEQTRTLLQNDLVSAPPGLAQRIMLACRMEGFRRTSPRRVEATKCGLPPEIVAMTLGLQSFDNFRHDEAEILPPAHLRDAILNLTTRAGASAEANSEEAEDIHFAPFHAHDSAYLQDTVLENAVLAGSGGRPGYSARRVIHRAFAFATPALLLFAMWPGGLGGLVPQQERIAVAPLVESVQPRTARVSSDNLARESNHALKIGLRALAAARGAVAPRVAVADANPERDAVPVVEARWTRESENEREERARNNGEERASEDRAESARARDAENAVRAREAAVEAASAVFVADKAPAPAPAVMRATAPRSARLSAFSLVRESIENARRSTPRLLTTVSATPVSVRTVSVAAVRPSLRRTEPARPVNIDGDTSSNDDSDAVSGNLEVAPVIDSYRAALAEDMDGSI